MGVKVWAVIHLVCDCRFRFLLVLLEEKPHGEKGDSFLPTRSIIRMPMEISPSMFIQASSQVLHVIFSYAEYWLKLA